MSVGVPQEPCFETGRVLQGHNVDYPVVAFLLHMSISQLEPGYFQRAL